MIKIKIKIKTISFFFIYSTIYLDPLENDYNFFLYITLRIKNSDRKHRLVTWVLRTYLALLNLAKGNNVCHYILQ